MEKQTQPRHTYKILCGIAGAILVPFLTRPNTVNTSYCLNDAQFRSLYPDICMNELYMPWIVAAVIGLIAGVVIGSISDSMLAKK